MAGPAYFSMFVFWRWPSVSFRDFVEGVARDLFGQGQTELTLPPSDTHSNDGIAVLGSDLSHGPDPISFAVGVGGGDVDTGDSPRRESGEANHGNSEIETGGFFVGHGGGLALGSILDLGA